MDEKTVRNAEKTCCWTCRWCITYKAGKSEGRNGCFGRLPRAGVQPTVVTRAEPHNLQLVHPNQDRVLTVREMARGQVRPTTHSATCQSPWAMLVLCVWAVVVGIITCTVVQRGAVQRLSAM